MEFTYKPRGTCSQLMVMDIENNRIHNLKVMGGCNGNLQGVSRLVENMEIDEVIQRLEGIRCGYKSTSCPDQLAQALKAYKAEAAEA